MNWSLPFNGCESIFFWRPILHLGGDFPTRLGQSKISCTWPTSHFSLFLIVFALRIPPWCSGWQMEAMRFQCWIMFECLVRGPNDDLGILDVLFPLKTLTTMRSWSQEMRMLTRRVGLTKINRTRLVISCAGTKVVVQFVAMMNLGSKSRSAIEQMVCQMVVRCWEFTMIRRWPRAILWNFLVVCRLQHSLWRSESPCRHDFEKGVYSNASKSGFAMIRPLDSMKESLNICFDFFDRNPPPCFNNRSRINSPATFGPTSHMDPYGFDMFWLEVLGS